MLIIHLTFYLSKNYVYQDDFISYILQPSSFRFFSQLVLLPPLPLKASQSESVLLSSQTCLDLRLGIGGNSFLSLYPDINCKVPEKPSLFKDVTTLVRP